MIQRITSLLLIPAISLGTCLAQNIPAQYWVVSERSRRPMNVWELTPLAQNGDAYAAYLLGRIYESGQYVRVGPPRPDLDRAVQSYSFASSHGCVNATYRLGLLLSQGKLGMRQADGTLKTDPAKGSELMSRADFQGYNPNADTVGTVQFSDEDRRQILHPQENKAADDLGSALLVGFGLLAAASLLSSGDSATTDDKKPDPYRTCQVWDNRIFNYDLLNPGYRSGYRPGWGDECPER